MKRFIEIEVISNKARNCDTDDLMETLAIALVQKADEINRLNGYPVADFKAQIVNKENVFGLENKR